MPPLRDADAHGTIVGHDILSEPEAAFPKFLRRDCDRFIEALRKPKEQGTTRSNGHPKARSRSRERRRYFVSPIEDRKTVGEDGYARPPLQCFHRGQLLNRSREIRTPAASRVPSVRRDALVTQFVLFDLRSRRLRKRVHEPHVARDHEMGHSRR